MPTLIEKGKATPPKGANKETIKYYKETRPVDIITQWIKTRMPEFGASKATSLNDRVLLVEAKTGSGKSTAMPVELYRILRPQGSKEYRGPGVISLQPRVITAMEIPRDIMVWAPDMIMGETIGYSTGELKEKAHNGLLFATTGTLLQQLRSDNPLIIMSLYRFIIVDEVHFRSLEVDLTLMLMKKLLKENIGNPECPFLILTSATFDTHKFAKYFDLNPVTNIISISGQTYSKSLTFLKSDSQNVIESIVETVKEIHEGKVNPMKQGQNDILIFVPGGGEMKNIKAKLIPINAQYIKDKKKCFIVLEIMGATVKNEGKDVGLAFANYDKLLINNEGEYDRDGTHQATERVIIASSVAETGITFPTLGHVIDLALNKTTEHYPPINVSGLITKTATKTMVTQRMGRAGRLFPGHYYGMYTEETFNALSPAQLPAMVTENIDKVVLDILLQQNDCFDVNKIDMLDAPPIDALKESIELNITLGYIDSDYGECFKATKMGEMGRKLRYCDTEEFRVLIAAYIYDVSILDIISIIVMGEKDGPRLRKANVEAIFKESLPAFFFGEKHYMEAFNRLTMDDFIQGLFIFEAFCNKLEKGINSAEKWCKEVKLDFMAMMGALDRKYQLMNDIINATLDPYYLKDDRITKSTQKDYFPKVCKIKRCLYDGYKLNLIRNDRKTMSYRTRFNFAVKARFSRDLGHPMYILTDAIKIDDNTKNPKYSLELTTSRVSVLDGYINLDDTYLEPQDSAERTIKSKKNVKEVTPQTRINNYLDILELLDTTTLLVSKDDQLRKYIT